MRRSPYTLYGWPPSPYTAKVRAYLEFKNIDFRMRVATAPELFLRIKRAVGRVVMPTLQTPNGTWLQDSSVIIDEFERRFPDPSITPPGPRQRLASALLELHGDEWLCIPALHYRWNRPLNTSFCIDEFGRCALPFAPRAVRRLVGRRFADQMRRYPTMLGVTETTIAGVEQFTETLLDRLDEHFEQHAFLLGNRPCLGDFALYGPLWAHLYRDPDSTKLFENRRHIRSWFDRLLIPGDQKAEFLPGDRVPTTLSPILRTMFEEHFAYLHRLVQSINAYCREHPGARRVPRALGETDFTIGGCDGTRRLITSMQWMAQRPLDIYQSLDSQALEKVDAWLAELGAETAFHLPIQHPFRWEDFKLVL